MANYRIFPGFFAGSATEPMEATGDQADQQTVFTSFRSAKAAMIDFGEAAEKTIRERVAEVRHTKEKEVVLE